MTQRLFSVSMCVFTLQQGGYGGGGHAARAEQHGVVHLELPLQDPVENHSCYSSEETHHSGLNLEQEQERCTIID